jgi:hypothetical protein
LLVSMYAARADVEQNRNRSVTKMRPRSICFVDRPR